MGDTLLILSANQTENSTYTELVDTTSADTTSGDELEYQLNSIKSNMQYLLSKLSGDESILQESPLESLIREYKEMLRNLQAEIADSDSDVQRNLGRLQKMKTKLEEFISSGEKNWIYTIPVEWQSELTSLRITLETEVKYQA